MKGLCGTGAVAGAEAGRRSRENWTRLRCRKNLLSEEAVGDSRGKGWKRMSEAAREEAEKQPQHEKVQAAGISGKGDQDFAGCGGNRSYLLFWQDFLCWRCLWIYRKLREVA